MKFIKKVVTGVLLFGITVQVIIADYGIQQIYAAGQYEKSVAYEQVKNVSSDSEKESLETQISSCLIDSTDHNIVNVTAMISDNLKTDDRKLYLFEIAPYEGEAIGTTPIASLTYVPCETENESFSSYEFEISLELNTQESKLYSQFAIGTLEGGQYKQITQGHYITNPELVAQNKEPQVTAASKKGLQVNYAMVSDIEDLGISQVFINFDYAQVLSPVPTKYKYEYCGKTYYFTDRIDGYDDMIKALSESGAKVTAGLVNSYAEELPQLRCPDISYNKGTQYYAFNTFTQEGAECVEAVTQYLVERYTTGNYGKIDHWVVGNEVNDNLQYNYVGPMAGDSYVAMFYHSFRTIYNAIKSTYSNADVYIPLEPRWQTANTMTDYGGKYMLNAFYELEQVHGTMDWGVAYHPYPYPLGDPDTLDDGDEPTIDTDGKPTYGGEVTMDEYTPLISMKNIDILTDYFCDNLKREDGSMRSIIVSEVGYTSNSVLVGRNEGKQAANIAYAYYKAESNPYIESFIIRAQSDENEGSPYFQFGLWNGENGQAKTKKLAYEMYKYIDTDRSTQVTDFAKSVLGIQSWNDIIHNFDSSTIESKKRIYAGKMRKTDEQMSGVNGVKSLSEQMTDYWNGIYEVSQVGALNYNGKDYMDGAARVKSNISAKLYQVISHEYDTPLNLTDNPYLGFNIGFDSQTKDESGAEMIVRIRAISGNDVYDTSCVVPMSYNGYLFADFGEWDKRNSINKIQIWVKQNSNDEAFDGVFSVYNTSVATDVSGEDITLMKDKKNISDAICSEIEDIDFTGKDVKPDVTVTDHGVVLKQNEDYSLSYVNNRKVGIGQVVITGIGSYSGTLIKEFRIISDYSDVFNPTYYLSRYDDLRVAYGDDYDAAFQHFLKYGMDEGRQGCDTFNVYDYKENYSDLRDAFGDDIHAYYAHYIRYGKAENRVGDSLINDCMLDGIDYSAVYNRIYFQEHNKDVSDAFEGDAYKMLHFFVTVGMAEGRRASENFDVSVYQLCNGDLIEAFGDNLGDYYRHYMTYGQWENRTSEGVVYDSKNYESIFDFQYYYDHNEDVAAYFGMNKESLLKHFVEYGMDEGRQASLNFNLEMYKENNNDVVAAYGINNRLYYLHYLKYGEDEQRIATLSTVYKGKDYADVYNKNYYLNKYGDLQQAIGDNERKLIKHFVEYGMQEGREACKDFNVHIYKAQYSDLRLAYGNDFIRYYYHYIDRDK